MLYIMYAGDPNQPDLRSSCDLPPGDADGACESHHAGRGEAEAVEARESRAIFIMGCVWLLYIPWNPILMGLLWFSNVQYDFIRG